MREAAFGHSPNPLTHPVVSWLTVLIKGQTLHRDADMTTVGPDVLPIWDYLVVPRGGLSSLPRSLEGFPIRMTRRLPSSFSGQGGD